MTWSLVITMWVLHLGGVEVRQVETLNGYAYQADCVNDMQRAIDGRMVRPNVVSASAKCVRDK
jgi:hypothetical protein